VTADQNDHEHNTLEHWPGLVPPVIGRQPNLCRGLGRRHGVLSIEFSEEEKSNEFFYADRWKEWYRTS